MFENALMDDWQQPPAPLPGGNRTPDRLGVDCASTGFHLTTTRAAATDRRPVRRSLTIPRNNHARCPGCAPSGRRVPGLAQKRTAATASRACRYRTGQGHSVWLNRDPIFEAGGINLYGFVVNSPLGVIDLFGLESYVCFNVEGWAGYGHVGIITHDPSTGSYTLFEHAHGMVSEKRRQDPKGLFRGFDIAFTIPDKYDQALDDARRNFMKKPGGSTLCNNCRTSVRDIFDAAAVPKPRDYGCSPNSWLNGFWAENYGYGYVNLRAADYIRENFYPPASRADMWRYQYRLGVP